MAINVLTTENLLRENNDAKNVSGRRQGLIEKIIIAPSYYYDY